MDLKLLLMKTGHHRGFNGNNLHIVKKKKTRKFIQMFGFTDEKYGKFSLMVQED